MILQHSVFFPLDSNAREILLPAASSSYDSPIATTFRMEKKHTHNCRNLARTRKKRTGAPSCCSEQDSGVVFLLKNPPQMLTVASSSSESPTATTFRMPKKKKHPQLQISRTRKKTQRTPSCFLQF
jgi:hypothetical protein